MAETKARENEALAQSDMSALRSSKRSKLTHSTVYERDDENPTSSSSHSEIFESPGNFEASQSSSSMSSICCCICSCETKYLTKTRQRDVMTYIDETEGFFFFFSVLLLF